jgi:hypothetical protein
MAELQRFSCLPEGPLRCYAIDLHLRRWQSAITHLYEAGGDDHFEKVGGEGWEKV